MCRAISAFRIVKAARQWWLVNISSPASNVNPPRNAESVQVSPRRRETETPPRYTGEIWERQKHKYMKWLEEHPGASVCLCWSNFYGGKPENDVDGVFGRSQSMGPRMADAGLRRGSWQKAPSVAHLKPPSAPKPTHKPSLGLSQSGER